MYSIGTNEQITDSTRKSAYHWQPYTMLAEASQSLSKNSAAVVYVA